MLDERADIVDRATDIVEQMVDDVVAVAPTDEKGRAIVPDWEADYRTYLQNRRDFADELRGGENVPFREAAYEGVPISERIGTFAADNEMESCAPPRDSVAICDRRSAQCGISLITRAGEPAATTNDGITPVTTLLAPITTCSPIAAPGSTTVPKPNHEPLPMHTGRSGIT